MNGSSPARRSSRRGNQPHPRLRRGARPVHRAGQPKATAESPKELFRERCKGCHELDRVYMQVKSERENPQAWMHVVTRMQGKAPGWISPEEAQEIVDQLRGRTIPKEAQ